MGDHFQVPRVLEGTGTCRGGDHFQLLRVSECTCTVLRTYLPTIRYCVLIKIDLETRIDLYSSPLYLPDLIICVGFGAAMGFKTQLNICDVDIFDLS